MHPRRHPAVGRPPDASKAPGKDRGPTMKLWRQVAHSLEVVVNTLLPVTLLPEGLAARRPLRLAAPGFDRWAHVHFGG